MKVKIFDCTHEQDLEEEINYFLYEIDPKNIVDIKYQVSSFYDNKEQIYIYSAMIIYYDLSWDLIFSKSGFANIVW